MSIRKILIIMIILSLTITAVSAASGLDEIVRIAEANGYHCAESYVDETGTNMLNFTKGSEKLFIAYANESTVLMDTSMGFEKKTINNTVGFYKQNSTGTYFHYNCGDDVILLMATDGGIIEKIVLGNEAPSL